LLTIPQVDPFTAFVLRAEIGGLNVHQSGQFTGSQRRMSKRGAPSLRQAAGMAIQYDPQLRAYYASRRVAGKAHGTVPSAICRTLLARIMVVLKQKRPYEVRASSSTHRSTS